MKHIHSKKQTYDDRKYPRLNLELPIHYKFFEDGKMFRALETVVENIGAMGLAAESDRSMHKGQHVMMTLFVPNDDVAHLLNESLDEESCMPVFMLSKIVWCKREEMGKYSFGVEFVQIENEHKRRFKDFLMSNDLYKTKVM